MRTMFYAAALPFIGLAATVWSGPAAALNSNPAPADNVRLYLMVNTPGATSSMDGAAPAPIELNSVMFTQMAPGAHKWTLAAPGGGAASLDFALAPDGLIESKGRRWWCLLAGSRNGQLTLVQMAAAQCKQIADAGPD